MPYGKEVPFETLKGLTLRTITGAEDGSGEVVFEVDDGRSFALVHHQDCCEGVSVEDVVGEVADLVGTPILLAEESVGDPPDDAPSDSSFWGDSQTWTYYRLATVKGDLSIRWLGQSNGYYSESVTFETREGAHEGV